MMTEQRGEHDGPWGVLNDWDHALWTDAEPTDRVVSVVQPWSHSSYKHITPQGTWQFISIRLLEDIAKPHDIFDDLESLLWVMLFLALHRFQYEGTFHMRLFDQVSMCSDPVRGTITSGGDAKQSWLRRPSATFECKPLQKFMDSFRSFHRSRRVKYASGFEGEDQKKDFENFEEGIKKNVYALLSYFDDVLNDSNADWTGQEARLQPQKTQQPPEQPVVEEKKPETNPLAQPSRNGTAKRKQGELTMDIPPARKRPKTERDQQTREPAKPVVRAPRRRRPPPPPSDRVLRPRPWRK